MENNIKQKQSCMSSADTILHTLLQEAANDKMAVKLMRLALPKGIRQELIGEKPTCVPSFKTLLNDPAIKSIELLLANPFGVPVLQKMDQEKKYNWEIWRIQAQVVKSVKTLLEISEQRQNNGAGGIRIAFHSAELIWNLIILEDKTVVVRSYGQDGVLSGHDGTTEDIICQKGQPHHLAESFISYYKTVKMRVDTNWIKSHEEIAAFPLHHPLPSLFKGNAMFDSDRDDAPQNKIPPSLIAKFCLSPDSFKSEQKLIGMEYSIRDTFSFFKMPEFKGSEPFLWRGTGLKMTKISGLPLFHLFAAVHDSLAAANNPDTYSVREKAAYIMSYLLWHTIEAWSEFRKASSIQIDAKNIKTYPYAAKLNSAFDEISSLFPTYIEYNYDMIKTELKKLGKELEKKAKYNFRDAHLKNRLIVINKPDIIEGDTHKLADYFLTLEPAQGISNQIFDIDFEAAHFKVTPFDDLIHLLFFENTGLLSEASFHDENIFRNEVKDIYKQWIETHLAEPEIQFNEDNKYIFWKTFFVRAFREFCRRVWYARVMPNTYIRRYGYEHRDYYLKLASASHCQIGGYPQLRAFIDICLKNPAKVWGTSFHNEKSEAFYQYVTPLPQTSWPKILLLGSYKEGFKNLQMIQYTLKKLGYNGIIVSERPTLANEENELLKKAERLANECRLVIVEDSFASGHLLELPNLKTNLNLTIAILREEGKLASTLSTQFINGSPHCGPYTYNLLNKHTDINLEKVLIKALHDMKQRITS